MGNPCRIKGAGEERAAERPTLSLDQLYELVELVPRRWEAFILLKTFASLRWGEITALTRADIDTDGLHGASASAVRDCSRWARHRAA